MSLVEIAGTVLLGAISLLVLVIAGAIVVTVIRDWY
jgi:hypothetical protein